MTLKRTIITGLAILALAFSLCAQVIPGTSYSVSTGYQPRLTLEVGNTGTGTQTVTVAYGYDSPGTGVVFYPLATGSVGQIATIGVGTTADAVTMTAVNCPTPNIYASCTFTGTINHTHGRGEPVIFAATGPPQRLEGSCSGAATASQTLGLYGLGQRAALACSSTVFDLGVVQAQPGIIKFLGVSSTVGGTTASSGVFTVEKNGSDTTVTCTMGVGTSCSDGSHFVSFVAGDVISVKFTTQSAETLAGVKAYVLTN